MPDGTELSGRGRSTIRVGDKLVRVYSTHLGTPLGRAMGYAWPTESGPRSTKLGRWDHIFLKGLKSPETNASGTVLDAYRVSDHRPVWAIAILQ